jgi:hypothetical protein
MDAIQQFHKSFLELNTEAEQKKTDLTEIIISDLVAKEKLEKIKMYILKLRVSNKSNIPTLSNVFDKFDMGSLDVSKLNDFATFMETALSPAVKFNKLIEGIGNILRSEEFDENTKVGKIGDLLI